MKHYQVATPDVVGAQPVFVLIDKNTFLVRETRHHTGALNLDGLIDENDQDYGQRHGDCHIAQERYGD
jgi:hypothetical protein